MEEYNFKPEDVKTAILTNKHNHITTTYYLLLKKFIRQGGNSIADLSSPEFMRYMIMMNKMNNKLVKVSKPKQIQKCKSSEEEFPTETLLNESLNSSRFSNIKPEEYYVTEAANYVSQGNQANIVFNQNNIIIGKPKLQAIQVLSDFQPPDNFKIINKNSALKIIKKHNKNKNAKQSDSSTNTKDTTYKVLNTNINYPQYQTEVLPTQDNEDKYEVAQTYQNNNIPSKKQAESNENSNLFIKKIIIKKIDNTNMNIRTEGRYKEKERERERENEKDGDKKIIGKKNVKYTIKNFINTSMSYCNNDIKNATYDGTQDVTINKKTVNEIKRLNPKQQIKIKICRSSPEFLNEETINKVFYENLQLDYSRIESKLDLSRFVASDTKNLDKVNFVIKESNIYNNNNKKNKTKEMNNSTRPKDHSIRSPSLTLGLPIQKQRNQDNFETDSNITVTTGTTLSNFKTTDQSKVTKYIIFYY